MKLSTMPILTAGNSYGRHRLADDFAPRVHHADSALRSVAMASSIASWLVTAMYRRPDDACSF